MTLNNRRDKRYEVANVTVGRSGAILINYSDTLIGTRDLVRQGSLITKLSG